MFSQKFQVVALLVFTLGNLGVISQHFEINTGAQKGGFNTPTINYMCDDCPPMWTRFQNNCYRYSGNATSSWQEAEAVCKSLFTTAGQGHLVSILSENENNFVYEFWRSSLMSPSLFSVAGDFNADDSMWIGLNDRDVEDTFEWSDRSRVDFVSWETSQPSNHGGNQDCVVLHNMPGPGWNDRSCDDHAPLPFMCKVVIEQNSRRY